MKLELSVANKQVQIEVDGELIGGLHYLLRRGNSFEGPGDVIKSGENTINVMFKEGEVRDEIECRHGLIRIKRSWKILKKGRWQLMFDYTPKPVPQGRIRKRLVLQGGQDTRAILLYFT